MFLGLVSSRLVSSRLSIFFITCEITGKHTKKRKTENSKRTRNKHPNHRPSRQKDNSLSSSTKTELLVLFIVWLRYLPLLPSHRQNHDPLKDDDFRSNLSGFILTTVRKEKALLRSLLGRRSCPGASCSVLGNSMVQVSNTCAWAPTCRRSFPPSGRVHRVCPHPPVSPFPLP